jgi:hypothetical protein
LNNFADIDGYDQRFAQTFVSFSIQSYNGIRFHTSLIFIKLKGKSKPVNQRRVDFLLGPSIVTLLYIAFNGQRVIQFSACGNMR